MDTPTLKWVNHADRWKDPATFNDLMVTVAANAAFRIPIDGTVLDLGCGDGFLARYVYHRRAGAIVGVDIDPAAIALANERHAGPGIRYYCGDACSVTARPASFDVVILRGLWPDLSEQQRRSVVALGEYVLKPGGWFVGDSTNDDGGLDRLCETFDPVYVVEYQTGWHPNERINHLWQGRKPC